MAWTVSTTNSTNTAGFVNFGTTSTTWTPAGNTPMLVFPTPVPFQDSGASWSPRGLEARPCHPDLPWQTCVDLRAHPPHRGARGDWNCRGRMAGLPPHAWGSTTTGDPWGWRSMEEALRDMRGPQPGDFVLCSCGCACECDGESHFNDSVCPCYYLQCSCVLDAPDEPRIVA